SANPGPSSYDLWTSASVRTNPILIRAGQVVYLTLYTSAMAKWCMNPGYYDKLHVDNKEKLSLLIEEIEKDLN
ncbi:hypothetical protein HDU80_004046, partial [Chytriomyces hyalinus]